MSFVVIHSSWFKELAPNEAVTLSFLAASAQQTGFSLLTNTRIAELTNQRSDVVKTIIDLLIMKHFIQVRWERTADAGLVRRIRLAPKTFSAQSELFE